MSQSALLCPPEEKAPREAANAVEQLEYLAHLVEQGAHELRESHVQALQALAVRDIYPCGGRYRDAKFGISISQSEHEPPEAALVRPLVQEMLDWCNDGNRYYVDRAAFALWRFNWIHPFAGGNGRTARALSYLVICMHLGQMLPGERTIPGLIAADRMGYIDALQAVDAKVREVTKAEEGGITTLPEDTDFIQPMSRYLGGLLLKQLKSG